MQLILDTEPTIDIKRNMSTLDQESLTEQLENVIQDLKDNICNGNKENIQTQNNVIIEDNKDLPTETDKINGNEIIPTQSPLSSESLELQQTDDLTNETDLKVTSQTIIEESPVIADAELDKEEESDPIIADAELDKEEESDPIIADAEIDKEEESDPIIIPSEKPICNIESNVNPVEKENENLGIDERELEDATSIIEDKELIENEIVLADTNEDELKEQQINKEEVVAISEEDNIKINNDDNFKENNVMEIDSEGEDDNIKISENEDKKITDPILSNDKNDNNDVEMETINEVNKTSSEEVTEKNSTVGEIVNDIEIEEVRKPPTEDPSISTNNVTSEEQHVQSITCEDSVGVSNVFEMEENRENTLTDKDTLDVDDIKEISVTKDEESNCQELNTSKDQIEAVKKVNTTPSVLKLSNTLDILSDDEDEPPNPAKPNNDIDNNTSEKQCINIEDDDDIMLIDEDTNSKESKNEIVNEKIEDAPVEAKPEISDNFNKLEIDKTNAETSETEPLTSEKLEDNKTEINVTKEETERITDECEAADKKKPLVPDNFLKTYKKSIADMTRDDLEEFCVLKIVESIVDRSNLSEIKSKLKTLAQNIEEYKKKAMMLTKQNRDLQVVLKSVQEEQKKRSDTLITPLKITRSVGMQVLMTEKPGIRRKPLPGFAPTTNNNNPNSPVTITRSNRTPNQNPRNAKQSGPGPVQIPVPRLVPASNSSVTKTSSSLSQITGKTIAPINGVKNPSPVQKPDKRPHSRVQMSVTVDLTDDEPPPKIATRSSPAPPVRLVPPQNLMAPQRQQLGQNSPRKVYIPISGPQANIRPGQTIMLKSAPTQSPRQRGPSPQLPRMSQNQVRMSRVLSRHPAPLPDAMKQYQPPHWKALPPAPDLKLSKVENGIVISWKIEGCQEDSYEEIASYQLYAYQETSSPPSTALWKKIGDVKALPLPMACTLTQFMAGFKYYFAVRAVDIRSRLGPFSLPGSILLLNKM